MLVSPKEAGLRSGAIRNAYQQRRDNSIIALRAMGLTVEQIANRVKVTPRAVWLALRRTHNSEQLIVDELKRGDVNAELILTRLSDMFNADIGDIIEPAEIEKDGAWIANPRAGSYRPIHDWPAVWRRMLSGSEVKELFEHSKDGEGASWDKIGELVKIKFIDPLKLLELAMKHKGVNAMVQPTDKLADAIGDLSGSIDRAIAEGRQRASQRNRLPIDVTPSK